MRCIGKIIICAQTAASIDDNSSFYLLLFHLFRPLCHTLSEIQQAYVILKTSGDTGKTR